ncbi:MAG: formylglycine-generating enzyme family protein, partial [Acidobacteria bacterium]
EWEKAARGVDGLIFPWGRKADANRANYDDTGVGERNVVGCFPGGASPYGIEELSGNVWEWTRSLYGDYPYEPVAAREDLEASPKVRRVVRGGSCFSVSRLARCAYRLRSVPGSRNGVIGFRVVVLPFPL